MRNDGSGGWKAGPALDCGRPGCYPLTGGLRVTRPCIYLRKIILRSWTGEDGGGEPTQKAGAEIQGSGIVGMEGCFARRLGIRTGRNGWAMEAVREAGHPWVSGSARCVGGDAMPCEGIGWGEEPGSASRGRQHWSGT